MPLKHSILLIGAFDTKSKEYDYAWRRFKHLGADVIALDFGIDQRSVSFQVDFDASAVAAAGGANMIDLRKHRDRGVAMDVMARGSSAIARQLYDDGKIGGAFGMGGSGGSSVITSAMRALPLGVPKVCLSTVAGGDTSPYVGCKDVVLILT